MTRLAVKGWCPTAHRPMLSGDGLIVRVRPKRGRLTLEQVRAVADLAEIFGDGALSLTNRANLQVRAVQPNAHPALLTALVEAGLVDPDPDLEARRNIVVAPFWREGDVADRIAHELEASLGDLPDLPPKFGFAVDIGPARLLADTPADIRIERSVDGGLIVRADGVDCGHPTTPGAAVEAAFELARWFIDNGGREVGRMARLIDVKPRVERPTEPAATVSRPQPGQGDIGGLVGLPFGEAPASALRDLVQESGARAVRLTAWRMLALEGGSIGKNAAFVSDPGDPILSIDACPGAPRCASAEVETRAIARRISAEAPGDVHVSGCAKGCARRSNAAVTLVGRDGRFDLVRNGAADGTPVLTGLTSDAALAELRSC